MEVAAQREHEDTCPDQCTAHVDGQQAKPIAAQAGLAFSMQIALDQVGDQRIAKLQHPAIDERLRRCGLNVTTDKAGDIQQNERRNQDRQQDPHIGGHQMPGARRGATRLRAPDPAPAAPAARR